MFTLTILFGVAVGLSLGLTGGGGSILAVPLLVYGLAVSPRQAVGVSLAAVGATALVGAGQRLWRGEVEVRTGLLLALSGMLGAPLGSWLGTLLAESLLLLLFSLLMVGVAVRMWLKASRNPAEAAVIRSVVQLPPNEADGPSCRRDPGGRLSLNSRCVFVLLLAGLATGVLSGLFGVGGGFVVVPALVLFSGLDIHRAVATSLLVIGLVSASGLAAIAASGTSLPLDVVVPFALGSLVGLQGGTLVARKLSPVGLQKFFAVVIVVVAGYVVARSFF